MAFQPPLPPDDSKVLTVSELTSQVQRLLEEAFSGVWVSGEVSNCKRHSSGHIYLTLKDNGAQIRAVIWRSTAIRLRFELTDGLDVLAFGRLSVYPQRGDYQLYIDQLLPKGVGALELAFRQVKEKLQRLGYFDERRKKPLPRFPRRIALVTSLSGAAIRDMLRIIPRRWPAAEIWVCPVAVQGPGAAEQIADTMNFLNRHCCAEVIIVGRGGGSLEDLWAFNEEVVAEAIFRSRIPVISAVGHQVDFTIADFVADRRAATPSEAAELVVPDRLELQKLLAEWHRRLTARLQERLLTLRKNLNVLTQRRVFRLPLVLVQERAQVLDGEADRLTKALERRLERARQRLQSASACLAGLSPLNVLGRGYSLTSAEGDRRPLRSADAVKIGERIRTRLARGRLISRVEEVHPEEPGHE